ncbi:hypothetical protein ZYGR_0AD02690 [Zygosaccharomyces rouxii]|uniref:ZYRO0G12232p n=2 Tax=Zygosaccharomyces rouxii TaxID=4956 RepID=C5E0F2_ZYGRC|nr:uncharacterized protein ZYRO0G12232g [Zygosaccharomyces rouxii]KAH9202579.1 Mad3/BUB1 homology region 1-domain-containing protein [Zygosaccharomyces rouxii]GAV51086.1 hypothetical protein ZYGR_0AD02690 [Zygosaccharomyces rouxii]CAR29586.1 ZYRO0G12232p [Zygosaccharomyces rouxii]
MRSGSDILNGPIEFEAIEPEKENIIPLKEGRSARGLAQALTLGSSELHDTRVQYERRLLEELEDMDDPLELFLEYISWINNAFPQGGTSKKSGMLDVIERCIMYFKDMETYKNDPRYLKVWLWYVELYSSDVLQESKDIFVYMFRKRIGAKLTLFYEEFATLLFQMEKFNEAHNILKLGVEENSRPQNRLLRKLNEFEVKLRELNVNFSQENAADTRFLSSDPNSFILGRRRASFTNNENNVNPQPQGHQQQASKYEVFQDNNIPDSNNSENINREGWDVLESKATRRKENKQHSLLLEPGSNVGTIEQTSDVIPNKRPSSSQKLAIFKDDLGRSDPVYKILHVPGKKPEKIDCNFDLIYPNPGEEYCIEEILAKSRDLYYRREPVKRAEYPKQDLQENKKKRKLAPLGEKIPLSGKKPLGEKKPTDDGLALVESHPLDKKSPGIFPQPSGPSSSERIDGSHSRADVEPPLEYKGVTRTSILPLRDTSDEMKTPVSNLKETPQPPKSPTMTFFSNAAMSEVYSMYNQHYNEPKEPFDNNETTNKFIFDNLTQEFTRQHMDDLTEIKPTDQSAGKDSEKTPNRQTNEITFGSDFNNEQQLYSNGAAKDFMTPIQERTEKTDHFSPNGKNINWTSQKDEISSTQSSPFLTQPQHEIREEEKYPILENPLDPHMRRQLLAGIRPPLDQYDTFYRYNQPLKMSTLLKRIQKMSKTENKNPIVDFKKTGDLYCIRTELGEGGYATVYLAESSTGNLRALKVEKPASIWEYYILKQVEERLREQSVLPSIINANSLHCFEDESYLVLNYASQGTILDLINLQKGKTRGPLDECLCMFFTVELMKIVESIHRVDILHGDLKPDNCMIRFENGSLGPYRPDGSLGWNKKGIYLIDFGRSFDMRLLPPNTKFKANWKTDQQDCLEMRSGKPWTYEADYYGLAGIIHAMLFGNFIESVQLPNGRFKLRQSFKRYWRQALWSSVFDVLLNSNEFGPFPITDQITKLRLEIESHLLDQFDDKLKEIVTDLELELTRFRR